jgi:hypothetical protein
VTTDKDVLTPTQRIVYEVLRHHPYGACRRIFSEHYVWEVSNRITEIERRMDIVIDREPCPAHEKCRERGVVAYRLRSGHAARLFDVDVEGAGV